MNTAKSLTLNHRTTPNLGYLPAFPAYALIFLMALFPLVPGLLHLKIFLLVFALVNTGILAIFTGRLALHSATATWAYVMSAIGFLFVLEGFFMGMTGAAEEVQIYVIWPLIYCVLIAGFQGEREILWLMNTIVLATPCVAAYGIAYSLAAVHVIPYPGFLKFIVVDSADRQFLASADGFIRMAYPGLNSLVFLVPFSLAAVVTCGPAIGHGTLLRRFSLWVAVLLGPAAVLLSGRRALYLVTMMAPLLTLMFVSFQPNVERDANRKTLIRITASGVLATVLAIASLTPLLGLKLIEVAHGFVTAFTFTPNSEDKAALYRREQFHALVAGWIEHPVFGAGYGAPATGSIRSQVDPSKYELYYLALLYHTGLIGFAAYGAGIVWIYRAGIRVIRGGGYLSALMVASLVGTSSILIANATNPYFGSFERMWPLFVPIALINYWLLRPTQRGVVVTSHGT